MEVNLCKGLMETLRTRLDAGAEDLYSRLGQAGVVGMFPATPIASIIIDESSTPENLLQVALQIRAEATSFRRNVRELEEELLSERVSLKRKDKILADIQALGDELWPRKDNALYKETLILPGVVAAAASMPTVGTISKLLSSLAAAPFTALKKGLRCRRIRVLLKAKKNLLDGADRTEKLARIFGLPTAHIRTELLRTRTE